MERRGIARIALCAAAAVAIGLAGCASTPEEESLPATTGEEFLEGGLGEAGDIEGSEVPERVAELDAVYFDFDRYDIREDAKPVLRGNAKQILDRGEWRTITVEGHCDERGSEEYNLALGERRANAAKRYLVNLGVPEARLVTVSFGESMPAVQGHDESAWRWNRRVEFRVSR